jgi:hypothetical protein
VRELFSKILLTPTLLFDNISGMTYKKFPDAKAEANRIGGVVTWWVSYFVHEAKDYSYATCGFPKFISKGAEKYFADKYKKELQLKRK